LELFYLDAVQFDVILDEVGTQPLFMDAKEYEEGNETDILYFLDAIQDNNDYNSNLFGDLSHDMSPRNRLGRAFHLSIDPNMFMREGRIYNFLDKIDNQELLGYNEPFDSMGFTVEFTKKQVHGYGIQTKATI
jgi:hypothetical protein